MFHAPQLNVGVPREIKWVTRLTRLRKSKAVQLLAPGFQEQQHSLNPIRIMVGTPTQHNSIGFLGGHLDPHVVARANHIHAIPHSRF
jgi:anthranilate phosphoribosyltransferase